MHTLGSFRFRSSSFSRRSSALDELDEDWSSISELDEIVDAMELDDEERVIAGGVSQRVSTNLRNAL
jgi:hypothetical protein